MVNQDPDGSQGRADVALLTDDDLIVAYESGPDYEILAQRLDPSGTTTGVVLDEPVIANYGNGKDREHGGNNHDVMRGGNGKDKLWGHEGDDSLFGNNGKDKLYGGDDHDVLMGGRGKDELYGGEGDDVLDGGSGKDWAMGGAGSDTFMVEKKTKLAIADFEHGDDQVWLTWGASEFDDLKFKEKKGDVVLKLKAGTTVVFEDVKDADTFDHHDFLFG